MLIHLLFTFFYFSTGVVSSTISPCPISNHDCLKTLANVLLPHVFSGIPDINVESSDPLYIEKIEGILYVLNYTFYDTTVTGFKDCQVSNLKLEADLSRVSYDLICPRFHMNGRYEAEGVLVVVPVSGKGDYNMEMGKYKIHVDTELKIYVGKDEKNHLSIKNFKLKCEPLEPINIDFRGLPKAVHDFVHENWKQVAELVQDPFFYAIIKKVFTHANAYLKKVSLEELLY